MISRTDIEDMTDAQDEAPERIWLQEPVGLEYERTWCAEQQSDDDTPYVRADLARPSQAGDERVAEASSVIQQQGAEWTASAMILHIAETLKEHGAALLTARDDDFGRQVLDYAAALAAMDTPKGGGDE